MTAQNEGCYSADDLASFLAGKFPAAEAPRLDRHLLDCAACRKTIEGLWRSDRLSAGLADRKATLALASRLGGEAPQTAAADSPGDEFLRRTRRMLDRFIEERVAADAGVRRSRTSAVDGDSTNGDTPPAAVAPLDRHSTTAPSIPGLRLGELLGAGGMGAVYSAWDADTDRRVACKVLSNAIPSLEERERFELEARAAERLDHPHIVRVLSSGAVSNKPFLVMEFAAGGTLQRLLNGQPQPPTAVAAAVASLADALSHAHHRGVLHRDIKPSNILLFPRAASAAGGSPVDSEASMEVDSGSAPQTASPAFPKAALMRGALADFDLKIADFGIAKLLDSSTLRTETGQLLGTPAFAAPEQFLSEFGVVGPAADVYSLGAILYLMLTGLPPLPEDNPRRLLALIRDFEPVAPRQLRPDLPAALEAICLCCLEKRSRWRYQTASELASDLRRFLAGEPIIARPRNRGRRFVKWVSNNRLVTSAVVALVALSAGSLAYASLQWRLKSLLEINKVQKTALSRANFEKLSNDIRAKQLLTFEALDASRDVEALAPCLQVALAPRGGYPISVSADDPDIVVAALRANSILDTLPKIRLRMIVPSTDKSPRESPSRNVCYNPVTGRLAITDASQSRVWEIDTATGRTTEHSSEAGPFSPDLTWRLVAAQTQPELSLLRANDNTAAPLPLELPAAPPDAWRRLWISPQQNVAVALGTRQGELTCYAWRLPSGRAMSGIAAPIADSVREAVFFGQGVALLGDVVENSIVWQSGAIVAFNQRQQRSGPVHIEPWKWTIDPRSWPVDLPASSPDARLWRAIKKLNAFTKCTASTISPSHTRIALGYGNGRVGIIDDIDCDLRFDKLEQLRHPVEKVAFSPDSQRLLAYSEAGELLVVDLEEARLAIPVVPHFHRIIDASWSPDGREIATLDERNLLTVWQLPDAAVDFPRRTAAESESGEPRPSEPIADTTATAPVASGSIQLEQVPMAQRSKGPPPHFWTWSRVNEPLVVLRDRWYEVWEPQTGRIRECWKLPRRAIACSVPDRNGRVLLFMEADSEGLSERALLDGSTGLYSPTSYRAPLGLSGASKPTERGYAVSMLQPSHVEHWWLDGRRSPEKYPLGPDLVPPYKIQVCPTGRELAIMTKSGQLAVWDLVRGAERFRASIAPPNTDMNANFTLDGKQLYVTSPLGMRGWETQSGVELKGFEAFRGRHVISLDFHPQEPLVVVMCDNREVTVLDSRTWKPLYSLSPNSTLTYAAFGQESGTVLIGMWNLPDANNDRLYLRELWSPAISLHGHAEMWDYRTASRISSAFAFRGFGDREKMLFSPTRVFGVDSHYRPRFGRWPTRDAYQRDDWVAIGTQFLQRDLSIGDSAGLQSARWLSATELAEAWRRTYRSQAAKRESP